MFDNWEGAKEILLREVESVVETRSKEKWKKTKDIRDRFFVRWKFIQERLHIPAVPSRTKQPFGSIFSGSAEKAWKYALKAINEDIHQGRIPNAPRKSAAALLLAWSIDSRQREIDIYSDVVSPEFRAALDQWSSFSERDIKSFIQLCWNTETEDYGQLNEEDSAAALSELLESLRSSMGESGGSDDFRVSRAVLMHCMGEDDVVRCGDFISTRELRAIEVLHWNEESIGTGLNHHPSERLPNPHTRPPEVQEQQYAKDSLVDERIFGSICACVIVLIIVSFLQGMSSHTFVPVTGRSRITVLTFSIKQ